MTIKLEALVCSNRLKIFEGANGTRNYLGFVEIDKDFTKEEMKYVAAMVYSRTTRNLKKAPKVEIELIYS